ncbi:hypothetical protein SAY87_022756 [Trapa incisa]|uniref:Uncharacterized protein n=1 Tax=Trapa incisa TaxID=236973 RepID=A0AAN7KAR1_9MYRT|nr:hypothetical protein SAY87_022756 [Trapa incisa]
MIIDHILCLHGYQSLLIITSSGSSVDVPSIREPFLEMVPMMVVEDVENAWHASRVTLFKMDGGAFNGLCMLLHRNQQKIHLISPRRGGTWSSFKFVFNYDRQSLHFVYNTP